MLLAFTDADTLVAADRAAVLSVPQGKNIVSQ